MNRILRMEKLSKMRLTSKRRNTVLEILNGFEDFHITNPGRNLPMDLFLRYHFLGHKKDYDNQARGEIVDYVYSLYRFKGYLNAIASRTESGSPENITWSTRMKAFGTPDFPLEFENEAIPIHARACVPKDLFDLISKSHDGPEKALQICQTSLEKPLLTIRANTLKTTREELMRTLTKTYKEKVKPCEHAQNGIRFVVHPETSLFSTVEYKKGHFEIQDEASQMLAMRVDARPKQIVLDYCGGAGGKTLAFAPFMHNTG